MTLEPDSTRAPKVENEQKRAKERSGGERKWKITGAKKEKQAGTESTEQRRPDQREGSETESSSKNAFCSRLGEEAGTAGVNPLAHTRVLR